MSAQSQLAKPASPMRIPPPRPLPRRAIASTEGRFPTVPNSDGNRLWPQPTFAGSGHLFLFMR